MSTLWALTKYLVNKHSSGTSGLLAWELQECMPLAWMLLDIVGTINIGSKAKFLSGLTGRGQEGCEKEKKSHHTGTREIKLFTAHMRYLGTQKIHTGRWEEEQWRGEWICMYRQLWAGTGHLFHED